MPYDKGTDEEIWDYLERKSPELSEALERIRPYYAAAGEVFDTAGTIWADDTAALCTRMLIAGVQLEFEALREEIAKAFEQKLGWRVLLRSRDGVTFQNPLGTIARLPNEILDVLVHDRPYDGDVEDAGPDLRFLDADGDEVAKAPKTLVAELRGGRLVLPDGG